MQDTRIATLGEAAIPSPLPLNATLGDFIGNFTPDGARVLFDVVRDGLHEPSDLAFEKAGPREQIFFEPSRTRAAIVTCGGLCPGLNNVIRSAYRQLGAYGVREVLGIRSGYRGLNRVFGLEPLVLTDSLVDHIHREGGSILGSSRGEQPVEAMLAGLADLKIDVLLAVGGDGTQRGALALSRAAREAGLPIAVVGIPKTIDNDIQYVSRSFGFATAVDEARQALACAHAEAKGYPNGVAIVRLMGRDSGFIAAAATVASQEVNFTLIPEVAFSLEGEGGFLRALERRLERKAHAVIAVAEGAGQALEGEASPVHDAEGRFLPPDIGVYLRDRIRGHFRDRGIEIGMKYIDPSYLIRSVPANSEDAVLCDHYARHAVDAAMAGKTGMVVGHWHDFIHVPSALATASRRQVSPDGILWHSVLSATRQPAVLG